MSYPHTIHIRGIATSQLYRRGEPLYVEYEAITTIAFAEDGTLVVQARTEWGLDTLTLSYREYDHEGNLVKVHHG